MRWRHSGACAMPRARRPVDFDPHRGGASGTGGFLVKPGQSLAERVAGAVQACFDPALLAAGDVADLSIRQMLEVVQEQGGLQIVRQPFDRQVQSLEFLLVRQRLVGWQLWIGRGVSGGGPLGAWGNRGVQAPRRVALTPAVLVAAEVGDGGEEPSGQVCIRPQAVTLLVEPHEGLRHHVPGFGVLVQVTPSERQQGALPASDQAVECPFVPLLQRPEVGEVVEGGGGQIS
jgi:hypothetical protein